jgi:hypothetical protein
MRVYLFPLGTSLLRLFHIVGEMATPNRLAWIKTNGEKKHENGVCHDDSSASV